MCTYMYLYTHVSVYTCMCTCVYVYIHILGQESCGICALEVYPNIPEYLGILETHLRLSFAIQNASALDLVMMCLIYYKLLCFYLHGYITRVCIFSRVYVCKKYVDMYTCVY
jgi:rubredoxin